MDLHQDRLSASHLYKVAEAPTDFVDAPPSIGQRVMLASGGPTLTVVDLSGDLMTVTAAWSANDGVHEMLTDRRCLRSVAE